MIGSAFLTYVKRTFKRTDKDTELYDALTETILDMKMRHPFEDVKTISSALSITSGDYYVALPSDFGVLIGDVRLVDSTNYNDSILLKPTSKQIFDEWEADPASADVDTDQPMYYAIYNNNIYVYPVSDGSYSLYINYSTTTQDTIVAATTLPFGDERKELLKFGTLYRIYRDMQFDAEAAKYKTLYEDEMRRFIDHERRNVEPPTHMEYQGV